MKAQLASWALEALGFQSAALDNGVRADTIEQARSRLAAMKLAARRAYRELARVHHPDAGGDAEKFRELAAAWEFIKSLEIRQRPAAPPVRIIMSPWGFGGTSSSTTMGSTWTSITWTHRWG